MYRLDNVYKDIRYCNISSVACKGRGRARNIEGESPIESVFITDTHTHHLNPMKHKLSKVKTELKKI